MERFLDLIKLFGNVETCDASLKGTPGATKVEKTATKGKIWVQVEERTQKVENISKYFLKSQLYHPSGWDINYLKIDQIFMTEISFYKKHSRCDISIKQRFYQLLEKLCKLCFSWENLEQLER